jgi:[acyl-carrier-protein] S-malonyltransferase
MKPLAILFAGQGAQSIGMGLSVVKETPSLEPLFNELQKGIHFDLTAILSGTLPGLNQTEFTQPSLLATSLLYYHQLQSLMALSPQFFLGFSLGEYTALYASGHLDLPTLLNLIQVRALAMAQAGALHPGSMAAIIGMDTNALEKLCASQSTLDELVMIANYNAPGQVVISGHSNAVKKVMALAPQQGAKRAIALNVSGAFHSPLMQAASDQLTLALAAVTFQAAHTPMIFNWTGHPLPHLGQLSEYLIAQVKSPVQFEASIRYLHDQGITHFLEIGPGSVLTGLVKKILPTAAAISYNGMQDYLAIKEFLS